MIETVIGMINRELADTFGKFPGVKIYGLVQPMTRKTTGKDGKAATEIIPTVVDQNGEGIYTGVDDTAPMRIYHKNLTLPIALRPQSGPVYGDERGEIQNLYNNALIIYFDRSKINLTADEVQIYIQAAVPWKVAIKPFKSISILFQSVNLNSQAVYQSEYQNGRVIDPKASMVQMNYQVEVIFSKRCFPVCV